MGASNKAQDLNCGWVSNRDPGRPCIDFWNPDCSGKKPAEIPFIKSYD
jgi:hypothetical protein